MERIHGEVLTSKERRRRWSAEEKLRIIGETMQPGVSVSSVARRHGLHPNQLFIWRTQARAGELADGVASRFVPVAVSSDPSGPEPTGYATARVCAGQSMIEIVLSNGRVIRATEGIAPDLLARLVTALEQR